MMIVLSMMPTLMSKYSTTSAMSAACTFVANLISATFADRTVCGARRLLSRLIGGCIGARPPIMALMVSMAVPSAAFWWRWRFFFRGYFYGNGGWLWYTTLCHWSSNTCHCLFICWQAVVWLGCFWIFRYHICSIRVIRWCAIWVDANRINWRCTWSGCVWKMHNNDATINYYHLPIQSITKVQFATNHMHCLDISPKSLCCRYSAHFVHNSVLEAVK